MLTAPRRYWITATIELVAVAKFEPSSPGNVADPRVNEPPWILRGHYLVPTRTNVEEIRTYHIIVGTLLLGVNDLGT